MPKAPWERERGIEGVLAQWHARRATESSIVVDQPVPARAGRFAPIPVDLDARIVRALTARGVKQLYTHQAASYAAATNGKHIVVATPTASGKSLCYNLPIAQALARDPNARAMYLFPTKALARDQEAALRELLREANIDSGAAVYDGDTPGDARRAARERGGAILTNPDMLHSGILPHHAAWARTFQSLKYVVIDELHTYKGVFGSHLANLLRRLRRIARFHGSDPVFLCASATIGNPREHATRLVGADVTLVDESGAPAGPRRVLLYNPPVVNAELGIRASYIKTAVRLTADLVRADVSTILFGPSRNGVETMLRYLRDALDKDVSADAIQAYRGGYLPETRRRIEQGLRAGDVRCVVATNALELGIDIGELDAVVCAAYPGSVAATWQRFGRAGRRGEPSLAVLVTSSAPIDQYLAREPHYLLDRPVEEARIDPDNVEVLIQHMKCAAFELPFETGEAFGDLDHEATGDALAFLAQHGVVHKSGTRWHWITDQYPAQNVSLRNLSWDNFVVVDQGQNNKAIAEVDFRSAHTTLFEQAIYQLEGETFQVERLDYENHKAFVRKVEPDYFTEAQTNIRVNVLDENETATLSNDARLPTALGDVNVVSRVVGYKKVKFFTHENLGYGDVNLPEMQMQTTAFWFTLAEELVQMLAGREDDLGRPAGRGNVLEGMRGLAHALEAVASLALMCDPRDLGYTLGDKSDGSAPPSKDGAPGFDPTIFLYDNIAGGVGLAARAFERREELLSRARELVETCPCKDGCPACVSPGDVIGGRHGRKQMALDIFHVIGIPLPM
jgi:DEAD/DEAH box helicase domain-containing protein